LLGIRGAICGRPAALHERPGQSYLLPKVSPPAPRESDIAPLVPVPHLPLSHTAGVALAEMTLRHVA